MINGTVTCFIKFSIKANWPFRGAFNIYYHITTFMQVRRYQIFNICINKSRHARLINFAICAIYWSRSGQVPVGHLKRYCGHRQQYVKRALFCVNDWRISTSRRVTHATIQYFLTGMSTIQRHLFARRHCFLTHSSLIDRVWGEISLMCAPNTVRRQLSSPG